MIEVQDREYEIDNGYQCPMHAEKNSKALAKFRLARVSVLGRDIIHDERVYFVARLGKRHSFISNANFKSIGTINRHGTGARVTRGRRVQNSPNDLLVTREYRARQIRERQELLE